MAVAVLPVIVAAAVLAIFAFAAAQLLRPILAGALARVPVVGGWIQNQIDILIIGAVVIVSDQIEAGIGELGNLFSAYFNMAWGDVVWIGYALDHSWAAVDRVANQLLPLKMAEQSAYTTRVWLETSAHTDYVWAQSTAHTDAVWAIESTHADYVWAQSTAYTTRVWQATSAHADFVWKESTDYTTRAVGDLAKHVDYVWGVTAGYAEALVGREMQRALDAERQLAIDLAAAGAGTIGTVESLWRQETARARGAEAGIAAVGAAAVAAVAARVATIEDSPCQRFCGPLGDLGGLLQGLEDAGLAAILLGVIAQARTSPRELAQELDDLVVPAFRSAYSSLSLGIP